MIDEAHRLGISVLLDVVGPGAAAHAPACLVKALLFRYHDAAEKWAMQAC
jgi:1,4-alpha-glucan branching enzyme